MSRELVSAAAARAALLDLLALVRAIEKTPSAVLPVAAFEVEVPFDSRQVLLCVRAPGYAMGRRNSALGDTPEITIERYGGTLV